VRLAGGSLRAAAAWLLVPLLLSACGGAAARRLDGSARRPPAPQAPPVRDAAIAGRARPTLEGDDDAADPRPNVVLLVADDLGWRDLGSHGNTFHETPHLDRLAAQGARFTDAHSNGPNCAPSRASLHTGQDTPRHGITTVTPAARGEAGQRRVLVPETERALAPGAWTLARAFADAGYRCASIGKWHLGEDPRDHGFHENRAGTQKGHPRSYFSPYENPALPDGPAGEHLTARLSAEALAFLEANADGPFFLHLSWFAVHTPIQPREDLLERYTARRGGEARGLPRPGYAAMVHALDESAGAVLRRIDELGLAECTLVVFLSDNGGLGTQTSMEPLRGSKGMLYEGGIRVPLLVRWPGRVEAGLVVDEPVIATDLAPTLLAAAGLDAPEGHALDGVSLWPLLRGEALPPRDLAWHFPAYLEGSRREGGWRTTPVSVLRRGDLKLLEFLEDGRLELYDLGADLGEERDLATERPGVAEELRAALDAWREARGAARELPPDPTFDPGSAGR
jgi:arylsulfatase A-like enzyme